MTVAVDQLAILLEAAERLSRHDATALTIAEHAADVRSDRGRQLYAAEYLLERRQRLRDSEVAACLAVQQGIRDRGDLAAVLDAPTKLHPHQWEGVGFLVPRHGALLAHDPGTGKSLMTLVAAEAVLEPHERGLILCPASLTTNWAAEIRKWYPGVRTAILGGRGRGALRELDSRARWHIVSYDTAKIPGPLRRRLNAQRWGLVVCDEAHRLKSLSSRRFQAVSLLEAERVWLLTGTPIRNRAGDLFALLRLGRHPLGAHKATFDSCYTGSHPIYGAEALAFEASDFILRRTKQECATLPDKLRVDVYVDIPASVRDPEIRDLGGLMRARRVLAEAKAPGTLDRVLDLAETGEKILVFSNYIASLDLIGEGLRKAKIGHVRIDGQTPQQARGKVCQALNQDPDVRVLIAQIDTAGEGLNLQAARHVVFNDLALVPASHRQAEDRAHRIGTKHEVTCHYMLSESDMDERVAEMLREKLALIDSFQGALVPPEAQHGMSPQELLEILSRKKK